MLKFNTFACLGQVKKTVSGLYMWKKKNAFNLNSFLKSSVSN